MIACPYQDLFLYINEDIHQKWNTELKEKNDKLKEIKPDTRPWKENNRCRKDETVINTQQAQSWPYITDPRVFDGKSTRAQR